MTTTEINKQLRACVTSLVEKGGLPGDETNKAFLMGGLLTEWLLDNGWEREQPCFWNHKHYKNHFVVTDKRELVVMEYNPETEDLEAVETLPHPVA